MYFSKAIREIASDIFFQTFRKLFITDNRIESGWALLVYSVDCEGIYFNVISFQAANIVSQYLLKNFILIGWSFPFAIRNTKFFRIMLCSSRYDLIAAIGTTSFVFSMVTTVGRFYFDYLFHDLFHRFVI